MILGSGLLARSFATFRDDDEVVILASGVSNSLETDTAAFDRERRLLLEQLARGPRRLVYFGSCGVASPPECLTPYMLHKREMESIVSTSPGGLVLRLPQVVGITSNPSTLTNYLRDRIVAGEFFTVWANAERNLVDMEDVVSIGTAIIHDEAWPFPVTTIAAEHSIPMPDIVRMFEDVLGRRANCGMEEKGGPLVVDSAMAAEVASTLGIDLGDGYAERTIRKYYAPH